MTEVMDVKTGLEKIEAEAKAAPHDTRVIKTMAVGQAIRQGDIYLRMIDHIPAEQLKKLKPWKGSQLVRGTEGGARHMAEGVKLYESDRQRFAADGKAVTTLLGPIVVAKKRCTITHPEHAHFELPMGAYQVVYQLDARTMQRVRD